MTMEIHKATRQGVRPLIGLYSESGCGKTFSALLLARGFVGPSGRIGMLDTEAGRGELYADVIAGGYDVLRLDAPFAPGRYVEAMQALHKAGCGIVIVDSVSHEWEGAGGILDMAMDNEERTKRAGLHNWKTPKLDHAKMVLAMLQAPIPLVVCMRAKHKTRQLKVDGKTAIVKDDFTTPIQADDFIFEMTAHGEIMADHSFRLTKCSHPALRDCFAVGKPITVATGEALAAWCAAPSGGASAPKFASGETAMQKTAKLALWAARPNKDMTPAQFEQWLWDESLISDTETLSGLSGERLAAVLAKVQARQ